MSSIPSEHLPAIDPIEVSRTSPASPPGDGDDFVDHLKPPQKPADVKPRDQEDHARSEDTEAANDHPSETPVADESREENESEASNEQDLDAPAEEQPKAEVEVSDEGLSVAAKAQSVEAAVVESSETHQGPAAETTSHQDKETRTPTQSVETVEEGQLLPTETVAETKSSGVTQSTDAESTDQPDSETQQATRESKIQAPSSSGSDQDQRQDQPSSRQRSREPAGITSTVDADSAALQESSQLPLVTARAETNVDSAANVRAEVQTNVPTGETPLTSNEGTQPATNRAPATDNSTPGTDTNTRSDQMRLVQRVSRAIEAAQQRGGGPIRLRLSPPELGSLRLEVQMDQSTLTARIETETSAARQAILDNLSVLRERLAEQGIRIEQFDVSWQEPSSNGSPQQPEQQSKQPDGSTSSDTSESGEETTRQETIVNSKQINVIV